MCFVIDDYCPIINRENLSHHHSNFAKDKNGVYH